ncbi:pentatricopeptide repeat-containing protein At2g13600 [Fagus crenata]
MASRHGGGLVKKLVVGDLSFLDSSNFAKLLDSCVKSKSVRDTCRIHARIIKTQFSSEVFIQNRLIDVYGKCGCLDDARQVFDRMPEKNTFTWNSIISASTRPGFLDEAVKVFGCMPEQDQCSWNLMVAGFAQHDRFDEALDYFVKMHSEDFVLNEYSFGSALSACSGLMDLKMGYTQNGENEEALRLFLLLKRESICPTHYTFGNLLNACANLAELQLGRQAHSHVLKHGFRFQSGEESDIFVDKRHPQRKNIYSLLKMLTEQMKRSGYVPDAGDHEAYDEQSESELTLSYEMEMPVDAAVV